MDLSTVSFRRWMWTFALLGVFTAAFPWVFAFKGTVFGIPLSLRAFGDAWGLLFIFTAAGILLSNRWRERAAQTFDAVEHLTPPRRASLIALAVAVYAVGIVSHKLRAQEAIATHAYDLGFFSNICWNTAHGRWFYTSLFERNFMGAHVNWILWPLSAFYRLGGDARVLLVAQALIAVAAVPFLWLAAARVAGSFAAGSLLTFLFITSKTLSQTVGNDFHPDIWLLPCLMASLWFRSRGRYPAMVAAAALALLAKEDVSVILSGYALFLMLRREERLWGASLLVIALGAFAFHVLYFTPKFIESGHGSLLYGRYEFLGGSFEEMVRNLFVKPQVYVKALLYYPFKYVTFLMHFFPVAWLTLLSPAFLLPPIVSAMPHLLSQATTQLDLTDIYALPFLPFIYIGAAAAWARLSKTGRLPARSTIMAMALLIGGIGVLTSPRSFRSETKSRRAAFAELRSLVPSDASMAAQQNLLPHFDTREVIGLFPVSCAAPELQRRYWSLPAYVAGDRQGNPSPYSRDERDRGIAAMETSAAYDKIFEKENFVLFRLKPGVEGEWINCHEPQSPAI